MKFFSALLSFILMVTLFLVTAHLTTDLLTRLLPDKYWYLPSMAVAAFDGGLIVWILTLLYVVENGAQRTVAWIMIAVDFIGVGVAAIADVFLADSAKGIVAAIPPDQMRWVVVGVVAVIIINVAAWSSMHVLSPEHIERTTGKQSRSLHAPTPQRKVTRRSAPTKIRVAQEAPPPRRVKQLAPPAAEEPEEVDEDLEDEEDLDEESEDEVYEEDTETEEVEVAESVPLGQRLTSARQALFPPRSGKKRLPVRK